MRPPIRTALTLWLLATLLSVRLFAAIAEVSGQEATASGDDQTITLPGATTIGNVVIVAAVLSATSNTAGLDGIAETETVLHGPADHNSTRGYLWCYVVTAADATIIVTTSGSDTARSYAKEFTGATCTEDGTSSSNATSATTSHALTTDITTAAGSLIIGIIRATTAANFSGGTGVTCIPSTCTDFGGTADTLGGYRIEASGGTYDLPMTSAANEDTLIMAAAVTDAGGGGGGGKPPGALLLRGVGETR